MFNDVQINNWLIDLLSGSGQFPYRIWEYLQVLNPKGWLYLHDACNLNRGFMQAVGFRSSGHCQQK